MLLESASLEIQQFLKSSLNQRSKLWEEYDKALAQAGELNKFSQFDNPSVTQALPPLSNPDSPPEEIAAAIWQLKQESEKIKAAEARIQSYQSEIEQTKIQFFMVVGAGVLLVIILLFLLFPR